MRVLENETTSKPKLGMRRSTHVTSEILKCAESSIRKRPRFRTLYPLRQRNAAKTTKTTSVRPHASHFPTPSDR